MRDNQPFSARIGQEVIAEAWPRLSDTGTLGYVLRRGKKNLHAPPAPV
jgi:hypothetical protein